MPTKPLTPAELAAIKADAAEVRARHGICLGRDEDGNYADNWHEEVSICLEHIAALLDEVERLRGAIVAWAKPYEGGPVNEYDKAWIAAGDVLRGIAGEA